MDITKLYVPNPQKWIDHYQKVGHTNHNGYIQSKNGTIRRQRGGELNSSTGAFMQAIDGKNIKRYTNPLPHTMQLKRKT